MILRRKSNYVREDKSHASGSNFKKKGKNSPNLSNKNKKQKYKKEIKKKTNKQKKFETVVHLKAFFITLSSHHTPNTCIIDIFLDNSSLRPCGSVFVCCLPRTNGKELRNNFEGHSLGFRNLQEHKHKCNDTYCGIDPKDSSEADGGKQDRECVCDNDVPYPICQGTYGDTNTSDASGKDF